MSKIKFLIFIISLSLFAQACSDDDDNHLAVEEPTIFENLDENPDATLLYRTVANLTISDTYGAGEQNETIPMDGRVDYSLEGSVSGQISGTFTATDYAVLRSDGTADVDIFGTIITEDEAHIGFNYRGERIVDENRVVSFQETGSLITHESDYAYLNDLFIIVVGTLDQAANMLTLSYYSFDNDPFSGEDPYAESESPDYSNFPFNLENIEDNSNATLVYQAHTTTSGVEGLGLNPADVFGGEVTIPAEGVRMNFDFAGTTTGELNGTIEGTDYLTILPDGSLIINVRGKIITSEGDRIALDVDGRLIPSETAGISNFFETATLRSNSSNFNYLNNRFIIGVGTSDQATGANSLSLYRFDENPLN